MPISPGQTDFKLAYEVTPITLSGGIAGGFPGGSISALNLLEVVGLDEVVDIGLEDAFGNFYPVAGSTLIENQVATYPFANMSVAANATVAQPLTVSLLMRFPARKRVPWSVKSSVIQSLQATLKQHIQSGGIFNVATPMFIWDNALLTRLHDTSGGETNQPQYQLTWDFMKPLVTLEDAADAQNAMMSNLSSGGYTDGALSGVNNTIGQPPSTAGGAVSPGQTGSTSVAAGVGPGPGGGTGFGGGSGGSPFQGGRA